MAFTTQQNFTATLDGTNAIKLNKVMDRSLLNYNDRLDCINQTLDGTSFFEEYFTDYYNPVASQNDYLSMDNNVCKVLENYATYLLNSADTREDNDVNYKFYYDEDAFRKAVNKEKLYQDQEPEVIDFLLAGQSNYKKSKDQKITAKDLRRGDWLGSVLRDYDTYLNVLKRKSEEGQKFKVDRIKGGVKKDMILAKDSLMKIHGYSLRYFSESTQPNLDVIDFANYNHLKGYSLDYSNPHFNRVDGLLRFKFNGDFQNDFQCVLYDLDNLIERTEMTDRERECLKYYRNGLTNVAIADIIGNDESSVRQSIEAAIKKVNHKAMELRWR
ncbi:sigma factor [Staphylococcus phage S-CoN_Ph10]|nr:sigma factor [Staphylococcus phage S-CoN_Ph10]